MRQRAVSLKMRMLSRFLTWEWHKQAKPASGGWGLWETREAECKGPEAGTPVESGTVREVTGLSEHHSYPLTGLFCGRGIRHQKQNRTGQSGTPNRTWCWPGCRSLGSWCKPGEYGLSLDQVQTGSLLEPPSSTRPRPWKPAFTCTHRGSRKAT